LSRFVLRKLSNGHQNPEVFFHIADAHEDAAILASRMAKRFKIWETPVNSVEVSPLTKFGKQLGEVWRKLESALLVFIIGLDRIQEASPGGVEWLLEAINIACPCGPTLFVASAAAGSWSSRLVEQHKFTLLEATPHRIEPLLAPSNASSVGLWHLSVVLGGIVSAGDLGINTMRKEEEESLITGNLTPKRLLKALSMASLSPSAIASLIRLLGERKQIRVMEGKCLASLEGATNEGKMKLEMMLLQLKQRLRELEGGHNGEEGTGTVVLDEGARHLKGSDMGCEPPSGALIKSRGAGSEEEPIQLDMGPMDCAAFKIAILAQNLGDETAQPNLGVDVLCDKVVRRAESLWLCSYRGACERKAGLDVFASFICRLSVSTARGLSLVEILSASDGIKEERVAQSIAWRLISSLYAAARLPLTTLSNMLPSLGARNEMRGLLFTCIVMRLSRAIHYVESGRESLLTRRLVLFHPAMASAAHFRYLSTPSTEGLHRAVALSILQTPSPCTPWSSQWWWLPFHLAAACEMQALFLFLTSFQAIEASILQGATVAWRHWLTEAYKSTDLGPKPKETIRDWLMFQNALDPDNSEIPDGLTSYLYQNALNAENCPNVASQGWKEMLEGGWLGGKEDRWYLRQLRESNDTMYSPGKINLKDRPLASGFLPGGGILTWVVTDVALEIYHWGSKNMIYRHEWPRLALLGTAASGISIHYSPSDRHQMEALTSSNAWGKGKPRRIRNLPSSGRTAENSAWIPGLSLSSGGSISLLALSDSGKWLAIGYSGSGKVSGDENQVVVGSGGAIVMVHLSEKPGGESLKVVEGAHEGGVRALAWIQPQYPRSDGCQSALSLASTGYDTAIRRWSTGLEPLEARVGRGELSSVIGGSQDGMELSVGSTDGGVSRYHTLGLEHISSHFSEEGKGAIELHTAAVAAIEYNKNQCRSDMMASGDLSGRIIIWWGGYPRQAIEPHPSPISTLSFSIDGRALLSTSEEGEMRLQPLDGLRGHQTGTQPHKGEIVSLSAAPNWQDSENVDVATGAVDGQIVLWEGTSGLRRSGLENDGENKGVWSMVAHPEGEVIFTGNDEGAIRQWNMRTGALLWEHGGKGGGGHTKRVTCLALSSCGGKLVSGSHDRTARVWQHVMLNGGVKAELCAALLGHQVIQSVTYTIIYCIKSECETS